MLGMNYFDEDVKCIVVRRDPRDTYLLAKNKLRGVPIPTNDVNSFVWFYQNTIAKTWVPNGPNVLNLNFEDLVYNYEKSKNKIENFLGIHQHIFPQKHFLPSISINNTQLYKHYQESSNEIRMIERELESSLFDFDSYDLAPMKRNGIF